MLSDGNVLNVILFVPLVTCCNEIAGLRSVVTADVRRASVEPICGVRSMRTSTKGTINGYNTRTAVVIGLRGIVNGQMIATLC